MNKQVAGTEAHIKKYLVNQKMRNAARQLRTEATGNLVFLRDTKMPQTDRYTPFQILSTMGEPERRQFGKEIFERVINYLRILAAEELYPNGVLAD